MADWSTEVAVVGAGPAGSHLASRLADAGRDVVLFDPHGAWEKPCGGGVPSRAIREFAFILENSTHPCQIVESITLIPPGNRRLTLKLDRPFAVFSRRVFNGLILDRAVEAGAEFVRSGVTQFERAGDRWRIATQDGRTCEARFLVGADGAASRIRRRLLGIFALNDLALAFGFNVVNGNSDGNGHSEAIVRFLPDFLGYLWAFPRPGVMNFGVAAKMGDLPSSELKNILSGFVSDYYGGQMPGDERLSFFGAKIPTLERESWNALRATGDGWALIGDAAGFADPITGEGIYYALKSADLLADAIIEGLNVRPAPVLTSASPYDSVCQRYEALWRDSFGHELRNASYRLHQFYRGRFFGMRFPDAVVRLARWHKGVRSVLLGALTGEQSYVTLKRDLLRRVHMIL